MTTYKKTYIPGKPRNKKLTNVTSGAAGVGKTEFNQVAGDSHTHPNKGVLDQITEAMLASASRDMITSTDTETELTDENYLSSLRVIAEILKNNETLKDLFLSKIDPDTAQEIIKFVKGIEIGTFTTGPLGAGAAIKMENGVSRMEVDQLDVRMRATFRELIIESLKHIGGQLILSPARMKCTSVVDGGTYYRCYFDTGDGKVSNEFVAGDQARCQVFTGSGVKMYWRLVTSVGTDWINLSKTDAISGSSIPEAGDDIVQLGHRTDTTRQNAQILSTVGSDAPSWKQYKGINAFSLEGKDTTVFSGTGNKIDGKTVFMSSGANVEDGINSKNSNYSSQPTSYKANDTWTLSADTTVNGIAYKSGEILTATQDSTTFVQSHWVKKVRYTDDTAVDNLQIGGRNYLLNSAGFNNISANNQTTWPIVKGVEDGINWVYGKNNSNNKYYVSTYAPLFSSSHFSENVSGKQVTVSVEVMSTVDMTVRLQQTGGSSYDIVAGKWTTISHTSISNRMASLNVLEGDAIPLETKLYYRNWKVELGSKATDWSPAPEDVQAAIDAAVVRATYWSVKASAPVIYKDAINAATAGSHTPVTVSGELRSGATTTSGGFITVTPNGGTEADTATASPVTIAPANGDGKTSYTVRLYDTASKTTLLDTMTIPVVFKGASGVNAINVVLSNEADVLPASTDGTVSDYSGSGTTIRVFEGATELSYGTSNGQYQVSAVGSGITVGTPSTSGNRRVYGVASNMTSDNATITFTITGKTASGTSFSLTKVQAFAKSRTGQKGDTGASAPLLYLSASAQVMKCNPDNTPQAGQTISIEAKLQNVTGTATFVATPYNDAGTAQTVITLGGTGNTRTLTNAQWLAAYKRIEVVATLGSLTDKVTIYRIADGAKGGAGQNAIVGLLTNESVTLQANSAGIVSSFTPASGEFWVYNGVTKVTSGITFSKVSETGCTAAITSAGVYSVSAMSADNATVVLRAVYSGVTIDKVLTLSKSRAGADGVSISLVDVEFAKNTDAVNAPTTGWSTTAPTLATGEQLWTRTKTSYSSGSPTYSTPANITPKTGATGTGIDSVTEEYAISTSKTVQPTTGWSTTQPAWIQGQYIWSRVKVVYKNPASTVYTGYAVSSEWEAINDLQIGGRNYIIKSQLTNSFFSAVSGIQTSLTSVLGSQKQSFESDQLTVNDFTGLFRMTINYYDINETFLTSTYIQNGNTYIETFPLTTTVPTGTKFISYTIVKKSGGTFPPSESNTLKLKLEKGSKATDWTEAPEDVQAAIDAEKTRINEILSDNIADPSEKQYLSNLWQEIYAEYPRIWAQANTYAVDKSTYETKYSALNTLLSPVLANLTVNTAVSGASIRTAFSQYYDARTFLLNNITNKVNQNAGDAKLTAEQAQLAADGYMRARYVRDWAKGNTVNWNNQWCEVKIVNKAGVNIALGKVPSANGVFVEESPAANITDNITTNQGYIRNTVQTLNYIEIDLGQIHYDIDYLQIWHWWGDGRTYYGTKTEISTDGVNWTPVFDSAKSGTYKETAAGNIISFRPNEVLAKVLKGAAVTDTFKTTINGGLISTVMILLRELNSIIETAGISGIQDDGYLPAYWSGGTYAEALAFGELMRAVDRGDNPIASATLNAKMSSIVMLHNGHAKVGELIVKSNGQIIVLDKATGKIKFIINSQDIPSVADLMSGTTFGESKTNPSVSGITGIVTLQNTISVDKNNSTLSFAADISLTLRNYTKIADASMSVDLFKNGVLYLNLGSLSVVKLDEGISPVTDSYSISKTISGIPTGTYSVKITVVASGDVMDYAGSISTSTLAWNFTQSGVRYFQLGLNGLMAYYSDNHFHYTETGGLDLRGATNMPGILASGTINADRTRVANTAWGAKNNTSNPTGSAGTYTVPLLNLSHANYQVHITPYTASRLWYISAKTSTSFTVVITNTSGTGIDTKFDYTVIGNNY